MRYICHNIFRILDMYYFRFPAVYVLLKRSDDFACIIVDNVKILGAVPECTPVLD